MGQNGTNHGRHLYGCVFFLDVKAPVLRHKLTECITKLGGEVAQFLDLKVKYVVTDRPDKDWPTKAQIEKAKAALNTSNKLSSQNNVENLSNIDVDLMPRGKMLALRATESCSSMASTPNSSKFVTNDVLVIAALKNITFLVAAKVLTYCEQHIQALKIAINRKIGHQTKLRQLKSPYIKYEDNKKMYKPSFEEFREWPDIHLDYDPFICPFASAARSPATPKQAGGVVMMPKNQATTNGIIVTNSIFVNSNRISNGIMTPVNTGTTLTFNTAKNFEKLDMMTPRVSLNTNERKDFNPYHRRRSDIHLYCDICSEFYKDLDEHLNTRKHQDHVNNKENYKDLIRVIKSLPLWTDITDEVSPMDNTCEAEEENSDPHCPSLTPPSSTTIRLTRGSARILAQNSNSKGTFLPLHDIAAINNNSNFKDGNLFKTSPANVQIFSICDDKIDQREEIIEASCITPPLIPPLLLQELEMNEADADCIDHSPQELSLEL